MNQYQIIGISHQTANTTLLSQLSLNGSKRATFLKKINQKVAFDGFVLSTCNRTEIFYKNLKTIEVLTAWAETVGQEKMPVGKLYQYTGSETVNHLFRVACGLDSKIIGDNEIIGQLKEAVKFQKENFGLSGMWQRIINVTIECSRRVRKETNFNSGSISTPYRITKIIEKNQSENEPILLVGAGEMIQLSLKYLKRILPNRKLIITNRSIEKARKLAEEFGADYTHFGQLETEMKKFSTIISAIQVERPFFTEAFLNTKPQLIFDLGIPCNFSAKAVAEHQYFDINSIAEFNQSTLNKRTDQVEKVEQIVMEQLEKFEDWYRRGMFYRKLKKVA